MMINYKNKSIVLFSLVAMLVVVFNACKKYENPAQIFEEYGGQLNGKADRKVLIINIAGVSGADMETIKPANIASMVETSKYSFKILPNAVASDAGTWASMLTGVSPSKHKIVDDSYLPVPNIDHEHEEIINYPSLFSRLLDIKPEFKTVVITPDAALNKYLIHAGHRIMPTNDEAVKDSAVMSLKTENAKIVLVDFRDVENVGNLNGFSVDVPEYKTVIEKTDSYVGEITAALKARKNFLSEDWLIIVTSNRGGSVQNPKPGFMVCYNPNLHKEEVLKVGYSTIPFRGVSNVAEIPHQELYDLGLNKDFTLQVQVKFNNNAAWPGFLSKSTDVIGHTSTGWTMIFNGGNWALYVGGKNNGGSTITMGGGIINDSKWHTLTFTIKTVGGVRTATIYTDGVKNLASNVTGAKSISTMEPLRIGYRNQDNSGTDLDLYIADLEVFSVALDDETILNNIHLKDIKQHPFYANLTGFWSIDDGGGAVLYNQAPVGYDFLLKGSSKWEELANFPATRTKPIVKEGQVSIVAAGEDIAALAYYWLRVPVKTDWSLNGVGWISNFELEFIK